MQFRAEEQTNGRSLFSYLVLTAVVCGALVMVIEVLGSRVIGPFFGVSLFVWTSLITVTLVALAAGYAVGGITADRRPSPDHLYGIILLAGVLVLLVPVLKGPVLKALMPAGLRLGALLSASLLFGPALFLLGCVSPYIIKNAASELQNIGRTVGVFSAISTIGSFVGTVLTGFVLIAYFAVDQIFLVVGSLLVILAIGYFAVLRKKRLLLAALLLPFVLAPGSGPVAKTMPNGTRVTRVASRDSFYGNVKIVDYDGGALGTREMMIDGLIQGGMDRSNGLSVYEYSYFLEFLPYGINPSGKTCLVIGLGAGIVPRWYESVGIATDVIDIDPAVVDMAQAYFGFRPARPVIISDARYYLQTAAASYDYIVLDVFNGDTTPGHVLSREALELLSRRMTGQGLLAINLIGSLRQETYMTASVVRTLREVFGNVDLYPTYDPADGDGSGNLVVIAYQGPPRAFDSRLVERFPVHALAAANVRKHLGSTFRLPEAAPSVVLTDAYNPIDFYDTWLKEQVRRNIIRSTDWDVLI